MCQRTYLKECGAIPAAIEKPGFDARRTRRRYVMPEPVPRTNKGAQDATEGRQNSGRITRQLTIQQKRVGALSPNAHGWPR
ncbi:hypothetical protein TUSST3_86870 [Streptomyces sp. TUS-ST3]|nr:hypothetical protein TUSST3_86870 [Streptomyces sp. TUS-ST3]